MKRSGVAFRAVSGTWTMPAVTCSSTRTAWSAAWVGIGGYAETSPTLAQIGTEADCTRGTARYSAWWELVPDASHGATITVRPGDAMAASVQVRNGLVRLRISDATRGTSFVKTLRASHLDRTSAEWIVEAPSACSGPAAASCSIMPLANFSSTRIGAARATTTGGHTGTIADPHWDAVAIALRTHSQRFDGPGPAPDAPVTSGTGARPGALEASGDAFTVSYGDAAQANA